MAVSSGFFNSVNHDRLYDAEQVSSLFDGIILDGVYQNFGEGFRVVANSEVNDSVIVKTGRAWFDHTWTYNDSDLVIQLDPPNSMLQRVDAIVIDVNREQGTRKNSVICVKGSLGESTPPTLVNTTLHRQYPLAYVNMKAGSSSIISQANITNKIGSDECPVVTGVLDSLNLDMYHKQLEAEFNTWWDGIKDTLDEATATKLQNQINELKQSNIYLNNNSINPVKVNNVHNCEHVVHYPNIDTSDSYSDINGAMFLPDKTIAVITHTKSDVNGAVYFFSTPDFVLSSSAVYENKTSSIGDFVIPLFKKEDSFPCKYTYLSWRKAKNSSNYITSHVISVYTLTIDEGHAVELSKTSKTITESSVNSYTTNAYKSVNVPAFYNDGSAAIMFFSKSDSYSVSDLIYFIVKVSPEGTISAGPSSTLSYTNGYQIDYKYPNYLFTTNSQDYIYAVSANGNVTFSMQNVYVYFIDPATLKIGNMLTSTTAGFSNIFPKNFLKINRPFSNTVYSYDSYAKKIIKFTGRTYEYEVCDYNTCLLSEGFSEKGSGYDSIQFRRIIQVEDELYMMFETYSTYSESSRYNRIFGMISGEGYGIYSDLGYDSSQPNMQIITDSAFSLGNNEEYAIEISSAISFNNTCMKSSDGKHIYILGIPGYGLLKEVNENIKEDGAYLNSSRTLPFQCRENPNYGNIQNNANGGLVIIDIHNKN